MHREADRILLADGTVLLEQDALLVDAGLEADRDLAIGRGIAVRPARLAFPPLIFLDASHSF
ncbi:MULTISPECIES: hypothetical protein [unclassified Massilia]|uniref:hypothetical protein n=1 Tax=unclassified Massilia TaxID=2609279 RepID=UPI000761BEDE|nr:MULTISPECIES: hypothetical protein [unclassified Massilia]